MNDARIASGAGLDAWAAELGLQPRRQIVDKDQPGYDDALTGMRMEPDDTFRQRILAELRQLFGADQNPQLVVYAHAALHVKATDIVKNWQADRGLPYFSPEASKLLGDSIYKALAEVYDQGREEAPYR